MATSSRRSSGSSPRKSPPTTPESARAELTAGRFREAVASFKLLLKQAPADDGLREGLASAYAGRASQLSAKGMHKEALAIWENRAALGPVSWCPDHALTLLRLGRAGDALALLDHPDAARDPDTQARLMTHCAAHYLAGQAALETLLPPDHPVRAHADAASAALAAYCAGDDSALAPALQAIPFRSPYRDLATLLKALTRIGNASQTLRLDGSHEERSAIEALLDRVPDGSGFAHLRDAARLALLPDTALGVQLRTLGTATRDLVFALRGWSNERIALWTELQALGESPEPCTLLRLMFRHRLLLGATWVEERGLRLLHVAEENEDDCWHAASRRSLTLEQDWLLDAWYREQDEPAPKPIQNAWGHYADKVRERLDGEIPDGSDDALRIALAMRRTEQLFLFLDHARSATGLGPLHASLAESLEISLRHDPDYQPTYLTLIQYFILVNRLKDARRLLALAQTRWPTDKAVLNAALDTALASEAFKKAAAIARDILTDHPIDSGVRERLVTAYLAHAQKNLAKRRPDLAASALDQAAEWHRGHPRLSERLDLMRGLTEVIADNPAGETRLKALAAQLGNGLGAWLEIFLATHACAVPGKPLLARLGLAKPSPTDAAADLSLFTERLREALDRGQVVPFEAAQALTPWLKRATKLPLEADAWELLCDTLQRTSLHEARLAIAEAALKRWRGKPIFELHRADALHREGRFNAYDFKEIFRLKEVLERASESGETRTAHRIAAFLQQLVSPFGADRFDDFEDEDEDDFEDDDEYAPFFDDDNEEDWPRRPESEAQEMLAFFAMIRGLGRDGCRKARQQPGPLRDLFRTFEEDMGKAGFDAILDRILDTDFGEALDHALPQFLQPPRPRATKAKSKSKPKPKPRGKHRSKRR